MANRWGNNGNRERLYFLGLKKSLQMVTVATKLRCLLLGIKAIANLESILRSRGITLPTKVYIIKAMVFPSGPITSWETDGEIVETGIFWGSKITVDGDCSHEIKRRLLFGRKVMSNLDSIFKSRDITLLTKVRLVKAMVFPVVMY